MNLEARLNQLENQLERIAAALELLAADALIRLELERELPRDEVFRWASVDLTAWKRHVRILERPVANADPGV